MKQTKTDYEAFKREATVIIANIKSYGLISIPWHIMKLKSTIIKIFP